VTALRLGIILILCQQVLFTLDTAAIHELGRSVSLWQLGLARSIGGIILVCYLAPSRGWRVFYTVRPGVQVLRAASTVVYVWVTVYSFTVMPFADATAISYTQAIYVALLAPVILGEMVGRWRGIAVAIGAIGCLLIVRPGFSQVSWVYGAVLLATSLNGLAVVLNKWLQRQGDHAVTVMLYVNVAMLLMFLPGLVQPWPNDLAMWLWLVVTCFAGPVGMYAGILALRYAEASTLAPFSYARLVLAMAGVSVVFGEQPSVLSLIGAAAIVAACLLASGRSRGAVSDRAVAIPQAGRC
jgi:drug/metabolite transporter (DMT)-like permease